jgi:hypothetical protein
MILHIIAIVFFLYIAVTSWNKKTLILWLLVCLSILVQWQLFNRCILNYFENSDNSGDSPIAVWLGNMIGLSYDTIGKLWVLLVIYIPALFVLWKLYRLSMGKSLSKYSSMSNLRKSF